MRARRRSEHAVPAQPSPPSAAPETPAVVTVFDYSPERFERQEVRDLPAFLKTHRPDWTRVRWINVDRVDDQELVRALATKYGLHPLAIEDVLTPDQRPKVDIYEASGDQPARVFLIVRMLDIQAGSIESEQIGIFLGHNTVLTFQQAPGDIWDPLRQRIAAAASRIRANDASFLVYTLLDAIVDHCYPLLETFGERLEAIEDEVLDRPTRETMHDIHTAKREMLVLRRGVWPLREVILGLQREPHECVSETTRTYLRDLYDHAVQIIDILETYRDIATGLTETYMSSLSNRMNEIMKVLTIIGTIFIPLTFLAGVYGMNMPIPENHWNWSYPLFWAVCIVTAGGMIAWFRRRGWI